MPEFWNPAVTQACQFNGNCVTVLSGLVVEAIRASGQDSQKARRPGIAIKYIAAHVHIYWSGDLKGSQKWPKNGISDA
ncbi:MAG: hypothetical protein V4451_08350 [Pseudomonadota bacterium]